MFFSPQYGWFRMSLPSTAECLILNSPIFCYIWSQTASDVSDMCRVWRFEFAGATRGIQQKHHLCANHHHLSLILIIVIVAGGERAKRLWARFHSSQGGVTQKYPLWWAAPEIFILLLLLILSAIITQHVKPVVAPECNNSVIWSFSWKKICWESRKQLVSKKSAHICNEILNSRWSINIIIEVSVISS